MASSKKKKSGNTRQKGCFNIFLSSAFLCLVVSVFFNQKQHKFHGTCDEMIAFINITTSNNDSLKTINIFILK